MKLTIETVTREHVRKVVAEAFTNGLGEQAVRLVLIDEGGHDLGGWSRGPLADFLCKQLGITK